MQYFIGSYILVNFPGVVIYFIDVHVSSLHRQSPYLMGDDIVCGFLLYKKLTSTILPPSDPERGVQENKEA